MFVSFLPLVTLTSRSSGAGVLADDHALVDIDAGADEQLATLLEVPEREGHRRAIGHADEHAALARLQIAGPGPYPTNRWWSTPSPRVSVMNSLR